MPPFSNFKHISSPTYFADNASTCKVYLVKKSHGNVSDTKIRGDIADNVTKLLTTIDSRLSSLQILITPE